MAGTTLSGTTGALPSLGDTDWTNLQNNWRETDAEWLQNRSVVRVSVDAPTTTNSLIALETGRVFYSTASNRLVVTTAVSGSGNSAVGTYRAVLASDPTSGLIVSDTSTTVTLGVRYQASTSNTNQSYITFTKSTGAISVDTLTATTFTTGTISATTSLSSRAGSSTTGFQTNSTGVVFNTTGSNPVTVTTSAAGLVVSTGLTANSFTTTGALTSASGAVSGTLTVGTLSATTVTTGTLSLTTLASTNVNGTTFTSTGSTISPKYTSATDVVVEVPAANVLRVQSATAGGLVNMYHGSGTTVRNAWVVYGGTAPAVGSVPEGTIWIS